MAEAAWSTSCPFSSYILNVPFSVSQTHRKNNGSTFASKKIVFTKLYFFTVLLTYIERYCENQPWEAHYYIFLHILCECFEDIICYTTLGLLLKTHRTNFSGLRNKNSSVSLNHWFVFNLFYAMNLVYSFVLEAKKLRDTHLGSHHRHFLCYPYLGLHWLSHTLICL